jgi:hypothetical protein
MDGCRSAGLLQQFLVGGFKQVGAVDLQGIADDL